MENLTIKRLGGALLLKYAGEITLEMTADLKRRLEAELGEGEEQVRAVIIDLSAVPFMDSSGIGFLVPLYSANILCLNVGALMSNATIRCSGFSSSIILNMILRNPYIALV